jgi:hypothetical protein
MRLRYVPSLALLLLVGCVRSKPTVIYADDDRTRVLEELPSQNDPVAVAAVKHDAHAVAVVDSAAGYTRSRSAKLRTRSDTVDQAIVRFLIGARKHGARAVTDVIVHETDRDLRCETRVSARDVPAPQQSTVPGRLIATDETVLSYHHAYDVSFRYRPFFEVENRTRLTREHPQVVVRLDAPRHRDRSCAPADDTLDPNGDLWVSGKLLY